MRDTEPAATQAQISAAVERARLHSPFLARQIAVYPDLVEQLLAGDADAAWNAAVTLAPDAPVDRRLRVRRSAAALVAALADLAGLWTFDTVTQHLSDLADDSVESALNAVGLDPRKRRIVQELPSTEAIKRAVEAGLGVGCVSRIAITQELATASLDIANIKGLEIRRPFSAILPLGPDPVGLRQIFLSALS